jgi:hypothetical protein
VDYDLDGDLDILIMPNNDAYQLYRNDSDNTNNYLAINLFDTGSNTFAINAKITVSTPGSSQLREITSSNNYVSNNPLQQHFGLDQSTAIDAISITWPDGENQVITNHLSVNQITSIGRYCHTKFLTKSPIDSSNSQITLYLHELNGSPLSNHSVNMHIDHGPNSGFTNTETTAIDGSVTFNLTSNSSGTDRINFEFDVNGQAQICKSLVRWFDDLIFDNGFDS